MLDSNSHVAEWADEFCRSRTDPADQKEFLAQLKLLSAEFVVELRKSLAAPNPPQGQEAILDARNACRILNGIQNELGLPWFRGANNHRKILCPIESAAAMTWTPKPAMDQLDEFVRRAEYDEQSGNPPWNHCITQFRDPANKEQAVYFVLLVCWEEEHLLWASLAWSACYCTSVLDAQLRDSAAPAGEPNVSKIAAIIPPQKIIDLIATFLDGWIAGLEARIMAASTRLSPPRIVETKPPLNGDMGDSNKITTAPVVIVNGPAIFHHGASEEHLTKLYAQGEQALANTQEIKDTGSKIHAAALRAGALAMDAANAANSAANKSEKTHAAVLEMAADVRSVKSSTDEIRKVGLSSVDTLATQLVAPIQKTKYAGYVTIVRQLCVAKDFISYCRQHKYGFSQRNVISAVAHVCGKGSSAPLKYPTLIKTLSDIKLSEFVKVDPTTGIKKRQTKNGRPVTGKEIPAEQQNAFKQALLYLKGIPELEPKKNGSSGKSVGSRRVRTQGHVKATEEE